MRHTLIIASASSIVLGFGLALAVESRRKHGAQVVGVAAGKQGTVVPMQVTTAPLTLPGPLQQPASSGLWAGGTDTAQWSAPTPQSFAPGRPGPLPPDMFAPVDGRTPPAKVYKFPAPPRGGDGVEPTPINPRNTVSPSALWAGLEEY
ncbi:hypothetical protein HUA74_18365 [Myxococcus sp. CA051A]|uniref:hypothetical protein n=1 Tax=Myxococcus sp. CA051A TaxID=2741739 RepID=UPI00157B9FD2|nr:hypothetical protein [Myxococcus sp. CA051A]NTX62621.1 hypothetical protein [Myxococcus sp. CA051A]